jgi:hypothetical protein
MEQGDKAEIGLDLKGEIEERADGRLNLPHGLVRFVVDPVGKPILRVTAHPWDVDCVEVDSSHVNCDRGHKLAVEASTTLRANYAFQ